MKTDGRESDNIEDRRGSSSGGGGNLGLIGAVLPLLGSKMGIGTLILVFVVSYFMGINPLKILGFISGNGEIPVQTESASLEKSKPNKEEAKLVSIVLADTEDVWNKEFQSLGKNYQEPKLVLFRGSTNTACGKGESAMGPFYCPADKKVYIDLGFFDELKSRFSAPGDFAQAYVVAHEVGHHVQNLLGVSGKVHKAKRSLSEEEGNILSVKLELQADCFAGLWGNHANKARSIIESGDLEEALNAATQIGDDTLQKNSGRGVVPESFTHGTSAQRSRWFKKGFEAGDINTCDTFKSTEL
jgi:uncharacterized protein